MPNREMMHRVASRILMETNSTGQSFASLTTALAGTNNDLVFTAVAPGTAGNSITVRYVDPGAASQALSVSVASSAITVNLATDSGSVITTTANDVIGAIYASAPAAALVGVARAAANDGTGLVIALSATALAGGGASALTSSACDGQGYDAVTFNLHIGAVMAAGLTYKITECDTVGGSYTDAPATAVVDDALPAAINTTLRVAYVGSKQFTKLVVTPTGLTDLTITVSLSRSDHQPAPNPT
jgi:hypothetical protein